jgi:hypothetical protein
MMSIDDFLVKIPPLSDNEAKRIIVAFGETLVGWITTWGERNNVPPDKRFNAFMSAVDLGYRIAKRDIETDRLDKLISS